MKGPSQPCPRCSGAGRVYVEDMENMARLSWELHKDSAHWPFGEAIKHLRSLTGLALADAKALIEQAKKGSDRA